MKKESILYLSIIVLTLSSCNTAEKTPIPQFPWVKNWLSSQRCDAPCWEGITPGVTTLYDISANIVDASNELTFSGPLPFKDGSYYFDWVSKSNEIIFPSVRATTISANDMTIGQLSFEFGREGSVITLDDTIHVLGIPESVGIYIEGPVESCEAVLLFPKQRIWLNLSNQPIASEYDLEGSNSISRSYFLSTTEWEEYENTYFPNSNQIHTWYGYGKYPCTSQ
jgi:hypothetical protein